MNLTLIANMLRIMQKLTVVFYTVMCLYSCQNNHLSNVYTNFMQSNEDIIHQKLVLETSNLVQVKYNQKTSSQNQNKVIILINTECSFCIKEVKAWDALIENDHFFRKMQVIFIADGKQTDYFTYVVNSCKSNFEVYIDSLKHFTDKNKLNAYPNETFLLNPVNEIILIGTPLYNPQIKRLYRYLYHCQNNKRL